ncbi:uncharacterized protein LOC116339826 [Contarinia nasturtii]|uniref:uncharacterized protein LOC116339826 n=1 Tax=Contarinia nasturtii TaxID=265458 RepID=UPI0012D3E536|nr:uncharacterized protein LOC116339826 [Contarinia nasturtii]
MYMGFVLFCLLSVVLISPSNGADRAVWITGESGIHADHPGKCWSSSLNREFNVGEEITDKTKCELIRCGANLKFSRRVCTNRLPQAGCTRIKPDSSKNYPDCCGMVKCDPVKIDY